MGNITLRILMPTQKRIGIVAIAIKAKGTLMANMNPKATTPMAHCTMIKGANVAYIWTDRISELAREMSWPDCERS